MATRIIAKQSAKNNSKLKTTKTMAETNVTVRENETAVAEKAPLPVLDAEALVKKLGAFKNEQELTGEYFNPEDGKEVKCWYIGNTTMNVIDGEGKIEAVKLMLEDKTMAITASAVIVGALSDLPIPSPVKIIKTGEKKLAGGKVLKEFKVSLLQ